MNSREDKLNAFGRLLDVMDELREKCPWDKKQTMESLRHLTIEETYELCDAILDDNMDEVKKELGDLLLHMVFYAKIGSERKSFDIADVLNGICDKLIFRHPHIYGDIEVQNEEEVKQNWEKLKLKEKGDATSVLEGVPNALPALVKATRIQDKVRGVGFDWPNTEGILNKIKEETCEIEEAIKAKDLGSIKEEIGDLLMIITNLSQKLGIDSEDALKSSNNKFINRFRYIEEKLKKNNKEVSEVNLEELDSLWDESKKFKIE